MQRIVISFIFVIVLSVFSSSYFAVNAQTPTVVRKTTEKTLTPVPSRTTDEYRKNLLIERDSRRKEATEEAKEVREAMKEAIEEKREVVQEHVEIAHQLRFNFMIARIEAVIARLTHIADRLTTRIEKVGETQDTTTAESHLKTAQLNIESAQTALTQLKTQTEEVFASEDPKTGFPNLKTLVDQIKQYLITAHKSLRDALVALKQLRPTGTTPPVVQITEPQATTPASVTQ